MEVSKRPSPPGIDLDVASSPSSLQPRKQAEAKRPREAAGSSPPPKWEVSSTPPKGAVSKRQRAEADLSTPLKRAIGVRSPVAGLQESCAGRLICSFLANHQGVRFDRDVWTEVAKHLRGSDLVCLSETCKWFRMLVRDDSIWRHLFLTELNLPVDLPHPPCQLHSWRHLYCTTLHPGLSHASHFHARHRQPNWQRRAGAFLLHSTHMLLMGKLPVLQGDADCPKISIETTDTCLLSNARPGVWIADVYRVQCLGCGDCNCEEDMLVLEVRNCDLSLEHDSKMVLADDGMVYKDLGELRASEETHSSFSGVCDFERVDTLADAGVFDTNSWSLKRLEPEPESGERPDLVPQTIVSTYGVAMHFNMQSNNWGLHRRFQAMGNRDGQILLVRILHSIL